MVCIPDFGQISARRTVQTAVAGTGSGYGKDLPGKGIQPQNILNKRFTLCQLRCIGTDNQGRPFQNIFYFFPFQETLQYLPTGIIQLA